MVQILVVAPLTPYDAFRISFAMQGEEHLHRARILATECIHALPMASILFGEVAEAPA
jgi:hypothetical protein